MARTSPLTVAQAAEQLNVAPAHVRLMIRRGRITATMFANVWMVDAASVKQYAKLYRRIGYGRPRKSLKRRKTP
ncbi:MAG: helix-turn-helix domain-containing protein [Planctomycetota bacterium]